ncbi:hypothetical protein BH11ACT2_BH11ACT2_09650 [soil metagenome]
MKVFLAATAIAALSIAGPSLPARAAAASASISGRVISDSGTPISGISVSTGTRSDTTDAHGIFLVSKLAAGTYTLKFSDPIKHRYISEYLGDATGRAEGQSITLLTGQKHTGVRESLTRGARITGKLTVAGRTPDTELGQLDVRLTDAAGATVARDDTAEKRFTLERVPAGSYTLSVAELNPRYPHVVGASMPVTVAAGQRLTGRSFDLQLVRGVVQPSAVDVTRTHVGSKLRVRVTVNSYGTFAGGTVTLKYHHRLHAPTTIGASGTATFTISTKGWRRGSRAAVDVLYSGTTQAQSAHRLVHFLALY